MRYVSDDGKVFNTEQDCCEHEQQVKNQKVIRDQFEKERQDRISVINKKYEELQKLISEYERDYSVRQRPYFAPVYELINMLCG